MLLLLHFAMGASGFDVNAEAKRLEAIERLKQLGHATCIGAEVRLRLGELYFEQATAVYRRSPDSEDARAWFERAARLYRGIIDQYPRWHRRHGVEPSLAKTLFHLNQDQAAVQVLQDIVRLHPDDEQVASAHLQIAEHHFRNGDCPRAIHHYGRRIYNAPIRKLIQDRRRQCAALDEHATGP